MKAMPSCTAADKALSILFCLFLLAALTFTVPVACAADFDDLVGALYEQDLESLEQLLAGGVDVNARQEGSDTTILMLACSFRDYEDVVDFLIEKGADVNARAADGNTAMMWAAGRSLKTVELLLAAGAEADVQAKDGMTPLIRSTFGIISESVALDVPALLIEKGARLDAVLSGEDAKGWTALLFASRNGASELVEFLLAKGAAVDHQAADSVTALMMAAEEGDLATVEILLAHGADPNLQDGIGGTALTRALKAEESKVAERLRKAGAKE